MNVNVWDVTEPIQAADPVAARRCRPTRLADPDVPAGGCWPS